MKKYTKEEAEGKLKEITGWRYGENCIEKKFVFKNFQDAMGMMVRIAFICEQKNHHPDWTNVYNRLMIRLSTHDAGGVTDKDFELAVEIENLFR